jgi:hypothetical protein
MARWLDQLIKPLEIAITCDARIPLSADDPNMENRWRCLPIPPTDDPGWFVIDDISDAKTVWAREGGS